MRQEFWLKQLPSTFAPFSIGGIVAAMVWSAKAQGLLGKCIAIEKDLIALDEHYLALADPCKWFTIAVANGNSGAKSGCQEDES